MPRDAGNRLSIREERFRFSDEANSLSRRSEPGAALVSGTRLSQPAIDEVTNIDELRMDNYRRQDPSRLFLAWH